MHVIHCHSFSSNAFRLNTVLLLASSHLQYTIYCIVYSRLYNVDGTLHYEESIQREHC